MIGINLRRRHLLKLLAAAPAFPIATFRFDGCEPTSPDGKGSDYLSGAPFKTTLANPEEPGERLIIRGRVFSNDCRTVLAGATLDVWQADAEGNYHNDKAQFRLRAQFKSTRAGVFEISSIRPAPQKIETGYRPANIHFIVSHPGHEQLTTQIYFAGDPYLAPDDACDDDCHSDDPARIIDLTRVEKDEQSWVEGRFDIVLRKLAGNEQKQR